MLSSLLVLFVVFFVTWGVMNWIKIKKYWEIRKVPHGKPHPILGSLTFLQRQNPAFWMLDLYRQFKSPYVGIWLFWRPALVINSPEIARNVLVKDFTYFKNRLVTPSNSDPIKYNMFTADDPIWSSVRRHLTSTFTSAKLKSLQDLFDLKSNELIQRINNTNDKTKLDIRVLCTDYSTDVISTAAFGVKTTATLTGEDPFRTVTKSFMAFDVYKGICWSTIFFFPKLADLLKLPVFSKSITDFFRVVFSTVSEQRKSQSKDGMLKDLLDALLTLKEADGGKEVYTDDVILAQAIVFLFGGYETSGATLTFMFYELAFQPEIQEKLYAELIEAQKKSENGRLDINVLADLIYLNCVIKETLRKYPILSWLDRVALEDYKIDEKLTVTAGTPILVNVMGMQNDSDYYPEPEKFNPDRFLPENEDDSKQFTYLPFGEGPRSCIGRRFGQITVRSALSKLILNYKIKPLPGAPKPCDIDIEKKGIFLLPGKNICLDFEKRPIMMT